MNAARTLLLKQAPRAAALPRTAPRIVGSPASAATTTNSIGASAVSYCSRSFGAVAAQQQSVEEVCVRTEVNVDRVRNAIRKMLAKDDTAGDDNSSKPISSDELEHNLAGFAHRFDEAHQCIDDCEEAKAGSLEFYEELFTAQKAVDEAFYCYVDLLDDFRRASDDQIKSLCQDRLALAHSLKALRQEVQQLATEVEDKLKQNTA